MENNGWSRNEMFVLNEIKRLSEQVEKLDEKLDTIHVSLSNDITSLRVKSGFWGGIAGFLAALGPILIKIFFTN